METTHLKALYYKTKFPNAFIQRWKFRFHSEVCIAAKKLYVRQAVQKPNFMCDELLPIKNNISGIVTNFISQKLVIFVTFNSITSLINYC